MEHCKGSVLVVDDSKVNRVALSRYLTEADYLPKPFKPVLLRARIHASLAAKRMHDQEEVYRVEIERTNRSLKSRVQEQVHQLRESFAHMRKTLEGTVLALSSAVEIRDPYTAGHQQRVTSLACAIGREMGLLEDQVEGLRVAGLLHDIGNICVPAEILVKPGHISEIEFGLIKTHAPVGYDILNPIEFPWPVSRIVVQHHENMNGSGYPAGRAVTISCLRRGS